MKHWYSHWIVTLIIILLGILFIFYFPIFYVDILCEWFPALNLEPYGTIGDTIGGMTGPFINLAGAILVYVAFNEQRKSNLQIEETHKFNYLVQQIDKLENIVFENQVPSIGKLKSNIKSGVNSLINPIVDLSHEAELNGIDEKISKYYYDKWYELDETDLAKILLIKYMFINILLDFVDLKSITEKEKSLYRRFLSISVLAYSLGLKEIKDDLISSRYKYFSVTKKKEEQVIELYSKYERLIDMVQKLNEL